MKTVKVSLGERTYPIIIGHHILERLPALIKSHFPSVKIVVLTNSPLSKLMRHRFEKILAQSFKTTWLIIPDGERFKNLKTVEKLYHQLVRCRADRNTGLIALGGGMVGDITGFVAATYLRGIPYIQVPTSLLAQVDSSVGGKTGVDLKSGKNLIGAFCQPKLVFIDTHLLSTLPIRQFLCGMSEIIKYGILRDASFFNYIQKNIGKIRSMNHNTLVHLIIRSCEIKAHMVSRDEHESGLRSLLNLGHTLGHAIESLSGYKRILHGEAISRGMVFSAYLSMRRGLCSEATFFKIENLFKEMGLPTRWPIYPRGAYERALKVDKKSLEGKIRFVAIKQIGRTVIVPLTPREITRYL